MQQALQSRKGFSSLAPSSLASLRLHIDNCIADYEINPTCYHRCDQGVMRSLALHITRFARRIVLVVCIMCSALSFSVVLALALAISPCVIGLQYGSQAYLQRPDNTLLLQVHLARRVIADPSMPLMTRCCSKEEEACTLI